MSSAYTDSYIFHKVMKDKKNEPHIPMKVCGHCGCNNKDIPFKKGKAVRCCARCGRVLKSKQEIFRDEILKRVVKLKDTK